LLIVCIGPGLAFAHEGHSVINSETALNIASKSVSQLTFSDLGFEIGKLDASWKSLTNSNYSVVQVLEKKLIVSATNTSNNEVIYFAIAKNGKLLEVNRRRE
jgi:hypothetical protein